MLGRRGQSLGGGKERHEKQSTQDGKYGDEENEPPAAHRSTKWVNLSDEN